MNLPQLLPPQSACRECELGNDSLENPGVPSRYVVESLPQKPDNPCFIILGQNPGFEEDKKGEAFVGRSGDFVRRTLLNTESMEINNTHCVYLMNVARCSSPAGMNIKATCYNTCYRAYTHNDLMSVISYHTGRIIILALGKPASIRAYQLLFPKKSPGTKIGDYFNMNGIKQKVEIEDGVREVQCFFTYHPAAILRENKLAIPYSEHLGIVRRHVDGLIPPMSKPIVVPQEEPPSYKPLATF